MKLSKKDRWIISNQLMILATLYPNQDETYNHMREIVESGYELNYDWITEHIYSNDDVMTAKECREVIDILDMFRSLKRSHEDLEGKSGIEKANIKFRGFDGNNETKQMAYTRFLVKREGKFTMLEQGDNFNSHIPMLSHYRKMLTEWKASNEKYNLTKKDITRIIKA